MAGTLGRHSNGTPTVPVTFGGRVTNDESTVRGTINAIDALLSRLVRTFTDCVQAQELAASVNEGTALCEADEE